jgi:hypothetical protein
MLYVEPTQTVDAPVIAATVGNAFTVINFVAVAEQPLLVIVYLISAVPANYTICINCSNSYCTT